MPFNLAELRDHLPPDSCIWRGDGSDWLLNLSQMTDDVLLPESNFIEPVGRLLQSIVALQSEVNAERAAQTPPLPPVTLVQKTISTSAAGNPVHEFVIKIEEKSTFAEVVDPTA